jgi:hypothetical protein
LERTCRKYNSLGQPDKDHESVRYSGPKHKYKYNERKTERGRVKQKRRKTREIGVSERNVLEG